MLDAGKGSGFSSGFSSGFGNKALTHLGPYGTTSAQYGSFSGKAQTFQPAWAAGSTQVVTYHA